MSRENNGPYRSLHRSGYTNFDESEACDGTVGIIVRGKSDVSRQDNDSQNPSLVRRECGDVGHD